MEGRQHTNNNKSHVNNLWRGQAFINMLIFTFVIVRDLVKSTANIIPKINNLYP